MSTKRKPPTKLVPPVVKQTAKKPLKANINESKTSIAAPAPLPTVTSLSAQPIEISSDSESNYDDISDSDEEDVSADEGGKDRQQLQKKTPLEEVGRLKAKGDSQDADIDMLSPPQTRDKDNQASDASDAESVSPTFGDLVRTNETVDVAEALLARQEPTPNSLVQPHPQIIAPPLLSSLGTVLNQALRTDDTDLLESCLNVNHKPTIHSTIFRLDSALAGVLLTKLAVRMHRRPGRIHTLMTWVQETLILHGGALATQPDIITRLGELERVLEERSRGLNSLLMLKGKLDMLNAQMTVRRAARSRRGRPQSTMSDDSSEDEPDDEEGIIYVEDEENDALVNGSPAAQAAEDEFTIVNGVDDTDDDSEDGDDDVDMHEPEVTDEESLDEEDADHGDVEDSGEEDDSDMDDEVPPAKLQKTSKAFSKTR